jgi:pyridoxamine 5'-phosphate oxidase
MKHPPPGRPVTEPYDDKNLHVGTLLDELDDPIALKNFRVVIIKPDSVEKTDLSDPKKARRYFYEYEKDSGEWTETEKWP